MANNPNATANLKPYKKGDSRINRKGRPKTFEALRAEALKIAGELLTATSPDGKKIEASRIHTILLDWAVSKDPKKQELFVSYAYGKVPTKEEHSGTLKLETWQGEVVKLLREGKINADDVKRDLGDDLARPLLIAASAGE